MAFTNNLAYEASAGSGKTFMLVARYISLLFMGAEPSKILALTFTNKAASEMSERVVSTLEDLASRKELEEIVAVTGLSKSDILDKRADILAEFLNAHTKIMTIDSFFTQILRKFSLYASLMPDFSTFTSQHELKLMSRFLLEVRVANKRNVLINLSLESKKRVSDIFTLLDEFYVKREELSHIKFSQHTTEELEIRAMNALNGLQNIVANCKGASASLIKAVNASNFEELKEKSWLVKESLEYWVFKKCFSLEMNQYLHIIQSSMKEYHQAKEQNFFYALEELVGIYIKAKKALYMENSELSFSDVTALVYEILHRLNDSEFLYFRLDSKIEHMLLDEFQDTSIIQYKILKPLIQEITSGAGIFDNGSFFFVGDIKQSIYRFRGGVSALFGEVAKENGTKLDQLLINYRSQKELIEFVNSVFKQKIQNYAPQLHREEAIGGYVEVVQNDELLEELIVQVKKFIAYGADLNDIAILCATNGDGEEIKLALQKQNIEVITQTTTKLIKQRAVQAVIEYLKYLYFGADIYKHNFFALIKQKVSNIQAVNFNKVSLLNVVKDLINRYKLFEHDFHLIRFINIISSYEDVEAFLFEYERLDTTAAASDLYGVRVLTIHKSKGLEFEHVIVLDRLKKVPPASNSIIYEYDGIYLQNVYQRTQKRAEIDTQYERALVKEQTLVNEDNLNALYVAFTRAKENLIIIKKREKSSFDRVDLELKSWGKLQCEEKKKESITVLKTLQHQEMYYGTQSDILALESEKQEDLKAINFGLALHYALEMMPLFKEENVQDAIDIMINKFGFVLTNEELQDIQNRVHMFVVHPEVIVLTDAKCYKEKAIRYKNNLRYLDLLVECEDGSFNIIDYKSSQVYKQEHFKQVHFYVKALQEITGAEVRGYICYLLAETVKIVKL